MIILDHLHTVTNNTSRVCVINCFYYIFTSEIWAITNLIKVISFTSDDIRELRLCNSYLPCFNSL